MSQVSVHLTAKLMCRLRPRPRPYEPITPWLSPWIRMEALVKSRLYRTRATSSTATASAQPMSLPSVCHKDDHCQASHSSPIIIPIPHDLDASTQIPRSQVSPQGVRGRAKFVSVSLIDHHSRSLITEVRG
jgi:hypothetical protein